MHIYMARSAIVHLLAGLHAIIFYNLRIAARISVNLDDHLEPYRLIKETELEILNNQRILEYCVCWWLGVKFWYYAHVGLALIYKT